MFFFPEANFFLSAHQNLTPDIRLCNGNRSKTISNRYHTVTKKRIAASEFIPGPKKSARTQRIQNLRDFSTKIERPNHLQSPGKPAEAWCIHSSCAKCHCEWHENIHERSSSKSPDPHTRPPQNHLLSPSTAKSDQDI